MYAYQADYVSGSAGHGVTRSGGLYISDGDFSFSASADTSISPIEGYRYLYVSVNIGAHNPEVESGDYAENDYDGEDYIQVSVSSQTITNGAQAVASHMLRFVNDSGNTGSWSDITTWSE